MSVNITIKCERLRGTVLRSFPETRNRTIARITPLNGDAGFFMRANPVRLVAGQRHRQPVDAAAVGGALTRGR